MLSCRYWKRNIFISVILSFNSRSFSQMEKTCLQIGLTGSIGMGKSTVAKHFQTLGFPVFDADDTVHQLYAYGGAAVAPIMEIFPNAVVDGAVSRENLATYVLGNPDGMKLLESVVHPLVAQERRTFYNNALKNGNMAVIYDIPLLLENPTNHEVDCVVVATASAETQKKRVMKRPGMTESKFESILARQMPDAEKQLRANFIVNTDHSSYAQGRAQVAHIIESLLSSYPHIWDRWKSSSENAPDNFLISDNDSFETILSSRFDAIAFDLDDTLVPVASSIIQANEALTEFMKEHMPNTAKIAKEKMKETMLRLHEEERLLAHDFTALRTEALRLLATPFGEEERVPEAMQIFLASRSTVEPYLYPDALPCLKWLSTFKTIKLAMFSNGNVDVPAHCPQLNAYFTLALNAGDTGASKPSRIPFIALTQRLATTPGRVLYIGDSLKHDVVGSHASGVRSAWIRRTDVLSNDAASVIYFEKDKSIGEEKREIEPDIVLDSLQPVEFERKLRDWILKECV